MPALHRLLITLLLAISLPLQGIAATWQSCCASAPPAPAHSTGHAHPVPQLPHTHGKHHHSAAPDDADARVSQAVDSTTGPVTAAATDLPAAGHAHACAHAASCCGLALMTPPITPVLPAMAGWTWRSFQAPAPDSHTPPTLDPPPRTQRS